ncbi:putative thylakoid lumenal protein, chloroplastic-like isoform 2 [Capsicum annuum]|nr:putative thylakoid lumenal protein, chloroplastic-like isoform 2 [Capsicum annuum]KAF3683947.1 putative thylakoid lumenal protein, chloroplastic-like isoform 2 [Capsicum annuum]
MGYYSIDSGEEPSSYLEACNKGYESDNKRKAQLNNKFEMKDLEVAKKILGMEIMRDREKCTDFVGFSTALAAAVITFSSNLPAIADLNKFEAETRGEFGISSTAQFGSADLKRVNFTSADMWESDFNSSMFNGAYLEKAVEYKANVSGPDDVCCNSCICYIHPSDHLNVQLVHASTIMPSEYFHLLDVSTPPTPDQCFCLAKEDKFIASAEKCCCEIDESQLVRMESPNIILHEIVFHIFGENNGGEVAYQEQIAKDITKSEIHILESIGDEENVELSRQPNVNKVKRVVFKLNEDNSIGSGGLTGRFYQGYWEIMENDILKREYDDQLGQKVNKDKNAYYLPQNAAFGIVECRNFQEVPIKGKRIINIDKLS